MVRGSGDVWLYCWQPIILQFLVRPAIIRHGVFHSFPVVERMVLHDAVGELVDDDVAEDVSGDEEECGVEHDHSSRGAASPLRFCEGDLRSAKRNAERLPVGGVHQAFHVLLFRLGQQIPQESVESWTADARSDSHGPTTLPRTERPYPRSQLRREDEAVDAAGRETHRQRFSTIQKMAERAYAFLSLLFQYLFHHASKEIPNVLSPFFL